MEENGDKQDLQNDLTEKTDEQEENTPQENEEMTSNSKETSNSINQRISNFIQKAMRKGTAAKHSLIAAMGPILLWGFVILVILIIAIGLIMFFITMPGMVMEQLKALLKTIGDSFAAFFGADTTKQIEEQQIYDVLDYLEQMGYDLKGKGFLTEYITSKDQVSDEADTSNGVLLDKEQGILRNKDDKIITAKSDFINTYIVSDNYVYTIANFNQTNDQANNGNRILGGLTALLQHFGNLLTDGQLGQVWGRGMLSIYHESSVGVPGSYYGGLDDWLGWTDLKIDASAKTLEIRRGWGQNTMKFSLDGWTGRYGMPIDFLLSVHLATLMPDLAYDMVETFDTQVTILLHEVNKGEAIASYKSPINGSLINYPTLEGATSSFEGRNWVSKLINWFDDLIDSDAEVIAAKDLGVDVGTGEKPCTCKLEKVWLNKDENAILKEDNGKYYYQEKIEKEEESSPSDAPVEEKTEKKTEIKIGAEYTGEVVSKDTLSDVCDYCKNRLSKIKSLMVSGNDYNFKTYDPYVSSVTDHWYRDVYFVEAEKEFVEYDHEYEAIMKERWTLYETYSPEENPEKAGEYKLYSVDSNGVLADKPFEGTDEEAKEKGIKLSKKAVTIDYSNDADKLEDIGWNKNSWGIWTAYEVNENPSSSGNSLAYPEAKEGDEDYDIKKNIYINVTTKGNIVQTGEGQRTETNEDIKKMFLQNRYFRYDGSAETAEIITKLRNEKNIPYGALSDEDLSKSITLKNKDGKEETHTVKEYSGNVTLNQDSLNAFSMLENEHTLDADYIYRDFKELIVELGYFTKEELTEETPRLLQWIIPDIGSGPSVIAETDDGEAGKKILNAARKVHDYCVKHKYKYNNSSSTVGLIDTTKEDGKSTNGVTQTMCSGFVTSVLVEAGFYDKEFFKISDEKYYPPYAKDFWRFGKSGEEMGVKSTGTEKDHEQIIRYMNQKFNEMEIVQDTWDGSNSNNGGIDLSKLQPGDILVRAYKPKSDNSGHVAIYAGDNHCYESTDGGENLGVGYNPIGDDWTRVLRVKSTSGGSSGNGTAGFPIRSLDKRVQEYGTMAHSKKDYEANKKNTLTEIIEQMEEDNPEVGNVPEPEKDSETKKEKESKSNNVSKKENSKKLSQVSGVQRKANGESSNILSSNKSNVNLSNVKGTGSSMVLERVPESGDGYESVVQSGNVKYLHRYQGGQSYSDINFFWAGQSKTLGRAACGLFSCFNVLTGYGYEFDPSKDLPGFKWPATMDAVKNLMEEKGVTGEFVDYTDTAALDAALNEGRPAILLFAANAVDKQGVCWTRGGHFVALAGKDSEGNILTLDSAAQGNVKRHDYPGTVDDMQQAFQSAPIWIADEPPTGMKKGEGNPYEGYEGNEAVVSPVTGILLDYGTYTDKDIDNVSGEKYRTNVDIKYGPPVVGADSVNTENEKENKNESVEQNANQNQSNNIDPNLPKNNIHNQFNGEIVTDKVGYAKILVLDAENYQKLESQTKNKWQSETDSLVKIGEAHTSTNNNAALETDKSSARFLEALDSEENMKDWEQIDKTVYGYKEFAESYEKYGIAGHVIYIDGFKCELPDTEIASKTKEDESKDKSDKKEDKKDNDSKDDSENDISNQIPKGKELTMDSFKKVTPDNIISDEIDEENIIESKYEPDEEYKLASKKITDKLNSEITVKTEANSTVYLAKEDLVFIKEGTVIGRTITDRELIEEIRVDSPKPYEYYRPGADSTNEENTTVDSSDTKISKDKVMGNYIRIIMRDLDDSVVENVEDYMKLDDGTEKEKRTEIDWEFYFWLPYESGGLGEAGVATHTGPGACGTVSGPNEVALGFAQWTCLRSKSWNNIPKLCEWLAQTDPGLCQSLSTFSSYSNAQICDNLSTLQNAWWAVNEKDTDRFLELQMQYFYEEEYLPWIKDGGVEWLQEKSLVAQGTYASLKNWGPNLGWEDVINSSMTDQEIVKALLTKARPIRSTCGTLESRWDSQYVLALDILDGTFKDVEEWIRTKQPAKYGEGQNPGSLLASLKVDRNILFADLRKRYIGGI